MEPDLSGLLDEIRKKYAEAGDLDDDEQAAEVCELRREQQALIDEMVEKAIAAQNLCVPVTCSIDGTP